MRKRLWGAAAGLAVAGLLAASPALASTSPTPVAPSNPPARVAPAPTPSAVVPAGAAAPAGLTCDGTSQIYVYSQYNSNYAWKLTGSDDHLEMYNAANGGATLFCPFTEGPDPSWGYADLLVEVGGSHPGYCLGWNFSKTQFDVRTTAPCNTNFTTGTWDLWQQSSANSFYELYTLWNEGTPTNYQCAWSNGLNVPVIADLCNGTNSSDHWQFVAHVIG